MSTKIETPIGNLPDALSSFPSDRRVSLVIEDSDEEKVTAINALLESSRGSEKIDGNNALEEIRAGFLALMPSGQIRPELDG